MEETLKNLKFKIKKKSNHLLLRHKIFTPFAYLTRDALFLPSLLSGSIPNILVAKNKEALFTTANFNLQITCMLQNPAAALT